MIDFDKIWGTTNSPAEKPSIDVIGELFSRLDNLERKLDHIESELRFLSKPVLKEALKKNLPNTRGCI